MSDVILKVEAINKQYRLGLIGTGTIGNDLKRWWYKVRGKEDPFLRIGEINDRNTVAKNDYVWALKNINFEVYKGEVLGIIGKNGAGKSTLLKILSRVTTPTSGVIKTNGRIASLLEVGTGFHPEMTGRENIYLNGTILGMTKAEIKQKEEEIITFSGCIRYIDTPVKRYSSGMRVRLAFAVAAHLEPDILVIDEVLAVGDAEFQKKAIGKMQDISGGNGRTVLFVSHNMAAVKSLCTRAIVLENGTIAYQGSTDDSIKYYLNNGEGQLESNCQDLKRNDENFVKNIFLKKARIFAKGKNHDEPITMNDSIILEYIIEMDDLRRDIHINSQFLDDTGRILFATTSKGIETDVIENSSGDYILSMIIPSHFFNQGSFSINCFIMEDSKHRLIDKKELLFFNVVPQKIALGGWMGKSKGPLRPKFNWEKRIKTN